MWWGEGVRLGGGGWRGGISRRFRVRCNLVFSSLIFLVACVLVRPLTTVPRKVVRLTCGPLASREVSSPSPYFCLPHPLSRTLSLSLSSRAAPLPHPSPGPPPLLVYPHHQPFPCCPSGVLPHSLCSTPHWGERVAGKEAEYVWYAPPWSGREGGEAERGAGKQGGASRQGGVGMGLVGAGQGRAMQGSVGLGQGG